MSLFERIKNIRYDLQEKKKFPGDESGAYQQAKSDMEARKGFAGSKTQTGAGKTKKITGLKADEKNPYVKRYVRKSRADKLGGDIYDAPKFSQKKLDKDLKRFSKGPETGIGDPFDTGETSKKTFKNFRKDSGFNAKKQAIKDIRASDKRLYDAGVGKKPSLVQQRKFIKGKIKELSRQTTLRDRAYGLTGSTEGMGGASGSPKPKTPTPTKGVKQSEVSKDQRQFDKKIDQARIEKTSKTTNTSGYSQSNKPTPGSEPTLFKKVKPNKTPNNIPVTPSQVVDSSPFDAKSGTKGKGTRTFNLTTPPKGKEYNPRTITKTRKVKSTIFNPPDYGTASYYKRQGKDAFDLSKNPITKKVSTSKGPQLPKFLNMRTGNINVRKTKGAVDYSKLSSANKAFARTSSAIVKKTPKALQKVASGVAKTGLKLGRYGRLGLAGGLVSAALSPAGRRFIGTALLGGGLAYAANRKGPPKLKVGDGITKTTNLPSKFQPKNAKNLSYIDSYGKKRKLESGDVRFKFGLTGTKKNKDGTVTPGGMQYNKQDMARVKNIQKKYIDSYNASVKGNPFKKQIKYSVNKDGSYTVTPPKKK